MSQRKKIKDLNQPEILKDTRIIIFFSYLVILSIVCYISYKVYQNKRKPLSISSQTFALIETKSSLPENTFLDLGNTSYDKIKQEVDQINSLEYCNQGQCVLDIKAGTKRCPANKNDSLIFNPTLELCTNPYSCPDSQPFAVQSTGETKLKYCEPETTCRCIKDKYCAPYVAQVLETTNGNPWIENNGYKNYAITALSSGTTEGFNFDPIVITPDNESTQYCKINPEYTQRIENGCDFAINSGEPMDCDSGSYLKFVEDDTAIFNVYSNNTNWQGTTPGSDGWLYTSPNDAYIPTSSDTTLNLYIPSTAWNPDNEDNKNKQTWLGYDGNFIPRSGYFSSKDKNYVFTYNGVINYKIFNFTVNELNIPKDKDGNDLPSTVTTYGTYINNITILQNVSTDGRPGLPASLEAGDELILNTVRFSNCIKSNLPSDNYKNMLSCVQTENQPCVDGQMAYNVDKGDPRQFSQYNVGNTPIGTPQRDINNYLNDPSYYTVSCVKGGGCSKLIDLTLCEDDNCIPAYEEKKLRFHSEVDDSAIATQWLLEHKNYQNGFTENYTYSPHNKQITFDTKNSLLTLENGDYWSLQTAHKDAYVKDNYPKNTISFVLNSTEGIAEGMDVVYSGMCLGSGGTNTVTVTGVCSSNNKIELSTQSYEGVCSGTQFKFFNVLQSYQYGLITNCSTNNSGVQTCTLTDLFGNNSNINIGTSPFIDVYKQFGFNGINYNTTINFEQLNSNNFIGYRKYTQNSFINLANKRSTPGQFYDFFKDVTPPLSAINLFQKELGINFYTQTFSDPYALYKRFNSMYYPVWNNNSFKQECIIPMPFLVAYPEVDNLPGTDESIGRILIQFSGKHFGHYAYYNDSFCYNLFTTLKKASKITDYVSSNQTLVLDQINKNINVNDLIASSDCSFDVYFVPDAKLNSSPPPSGVSFQISIASNNMTAKNYTQLDDKYMPLVYNGKVYEDSNSYIIGDGTTYNFYNNTNNKNYFLGKVYRGIHNGTTYHFNLKTNSKVESIDQNLVSNKYGFCQYFTK